MIFVLSQLLCKWSIGRAIDFNMSPPVKSLHCRLKWINHRLGSPKHIPTKLFFIVQLMVVYYGCLDCCLRHCLRDYAVIPGDFIFYGGSQPVISSLFRSDHVSWATTSRSWWKVLQSTAAYKYCFFWQSVGTVYNATANFLVEWLSDGNLWVLG